ncbi:MAG: exodeoxyribonuclease VII small subunit [Lachnospiraceae bacterium]|nr:exodeoxyribonuclease VII small subunit [Lachnospiraceae bacterium]
MAVEDKNIKLEDAFEKLDSIIEEMQKSDISLDDAFKNYKEGMGLVEVCNKSIERVEKEMQTIDEASSTGSEG